MPFQKGNNANPGGRPRVVRTLERSIRKGSMQAVQRMCKLVESEDERVALSASQYLLDRVMGKPSQKHEVEGNVSVNHLHLTAVRELSKRTLQPPAEDAKIIEEQPKPVSDESRDAAKQAFAERKRAGQ